MYFPSILHSIQGYSILFCLKVTHFVWCISGRPTDGTISLIKYYSITRLNQKHLSRIYWWLERYVKSEFFFSLSSLFLKREMTRSPLQRIECPEHYTFFSLLHTWSVKCSADSPTETQKQKKKSHPREKQKRPLSWQEVVILLLFLCLILLFECCWLNWRRGSKYLLIRINKL